MLGNMSQVRLVRASKVSPAWLRKEAELVFTSGAFQTVFLWFFRSIATVVHGFLGIAAI